jgi:hypothetical protein
VRAPAIRRSCPAGLWAFFVYTVAEKSEPVSARNGLSVNPRYSIYDCPDPDIVLVPADAARRRLFTMRRYLTG